MKRIYFDNAATTPLDKRVAKAMWDFEMQYYGNPNSIHREGQTARAKIDYAREAISKFITSQPQEIIFTSGATESNNHAIRGVVSNALIHLKIKPHIISTELEHQSVYTTLKDLEKRGVVEVTFIKPTPDGLIDANEIIKAIKNNTVLVSVIFVSNEIGSILPIREIGKALKTINLNLKSNIYFHTDAVQALKYFNCNVEKLGVDLMTFSAHKINGPKGIGALYIKSGTKIDNLMTGGSQEYQKRPGTQNSAGIIGFAKVIELLGSLEDRQKNANKVSTLRDKLLEVIKGLPNVTINGPTNKFRTPDNINFSISGFDPDLIMAKLDLAAIAASTGSACVSGSTEPSHVIKALRRLSTNEPAATIRLTLGAQNKLSEVDYVIEVLTAMTKGT